jgi:hypothetical protein
MEFLLLSRGSLEVENLKEKNKTKPKTSSLC